MGRQYYVGEEPIPGYQLSKLIGRGRFGSVWKADASGSTEVALKIIPIDGDENFKKVRRLRLIAHVKHPNLIPILAVWLRDSDGQVIDDDDIDAGVGSAGPGAEIIVANGLGEKSLADRLGECLENNMAGVPIDELLGYFEDAARGIDHLNQLNTSGDSASTGIPHCNVKPANILVVGGAAQVGDYGLVHVLGPKQKTVGSTPYFLAPELFLQTQPGPTTDQYSLAISYVQLRTGSLPMQANSPAAVVAAHVRGLLDLSRLPDAERHIIQKATSLDPTQRFPRCIDMVRALRQTLHPSDTSLLSSTPSSRPPRREGSFLLEKGLEIVPGYRLIRLIGRGGYGEVWESSAPGNLPIAMKVVRSLDAKTGRQEFKALQLIRNVNHPHLLGLHAYWLLDAAGNLIPDELVGTPNAPPPATLVLASRLADKNLLQRLKECKQETQSGIPPAELFEYMHQSATAIDYLNAPRHPLGDKKVSIQHRDIKPENILLAGEVAIVADFGLARLLEGSADRINTDSVGLTLLYAAPEMLSGSISMWSDQYSLGITYYHMRTGTIPFGSNLSPYAVIQAHVKGQLDLSLLPDAERRVISKATALKPEERHPNCVAMVRALRDALVAAASPVVVKSILEFVMPSSASRPHGDMVGGDTPNSAIQTGETLDSPPPRPRLLTPARGTELTPSGTTDPGSTTGLETVGSIQHGQPTPLQTTKQTGSHERLMDTDFRLPPIGEPRRRGWKLTLLLLMAVAVGGGAWFGWPYLERFRHGVVQQRYTPEEIRKVIVEGQYTDALAMIDNSGLDGPTQADLRDWVKTSWQRDIRTELSQEHDAQVEAMSLQLLEQFPDDEPTLGLRKKTLDRLLPVQVKKAVDDQRFDTAFQLLGKPHYQSPVIAEQKMLIHDAWLQAARAHVKAQKYTDAVAVLDQMLKAFPDDPAAVPERLSARRDSVRLEVEELAAADKFPDAGKLLQARRDLLGKATFDNLKETLLADWLKRAAQESDKSKEGESLKQLLAFAEYLPASERLKKLGLNTADPAVVQALTAQLAEGEKLLAGNPTQALKKFDDVLKHRDIELLTTVRHRGLLDKARAQARLGQWDNLKTTLDRLGTSFSATDRSYVQVLRFLADDAGKPTAVKQLTALTELRQGAPELAKLDAWERDQVKAVQDRTLDTAIRSASNLRDQADRRDEALGQVERVLKLEPEHVPGLLLKADLHYRKPDWTAVRETLGRLKEALRKLDKKVSPRDRAEADALTALVGARDDAAPAERTEAVKLLQQLLTDPAPPRRADLCQALAELAGKDAALRSSAAVLLRKVHAALPAGTEKDQIASALRVLYREIIGEAEQQLNDKKYAAVAALLTEAEMLVPDAAARADLDALRAVTWLQQPGTPEQRAKALDVARRLLGQPSAPRAVELCDGLVRLADSDERHLSDVRQILTQALAALPAGPARDQVRVGQRRLVGLDLKRRLAVTDKAPDWGQLLKDCQDADVSGWAQVGMAESILERSTKLDPVELKKVQAALDSKLAADTGVYVQYVRSLLSLAEGKLDQAAAQVLEAYKADPTPTILTGFRRTEAVTILRSAIDRQRADLGNPLAAPFRSAAAADQAYAWAAKAQQLWTQGEQTPRVDLHVVQALALGYQTKPDRAAALKLIDALLAKPGADKLGDALPALLLLKARSQPDTVAGRRSALDTYGELAERLHGQTLADEKLALAVYHQVLEPALKLAGTLPAGSDDDAKKLARLHVALGHLITNNIYAAWPFKDARQTAVNAFGDAVRLDSRKAEYYVWRGFTRAVQPNANLADVKKDAEDAIKYNNSLAGAHGLRGYAALIQSRREADLDARLRQLREAVASCAESVLLTRKNNDPPSERASYLVNLSAASLDLANYLPSTQVAEKKQLFTQARDLALEATQVGDRPYPESAWQALGNAHEDLASQLDDNKAYNFGKAVDAFSRAITDRKDPRAQLSVGRCVYKSVAAGASAPGELAVAVQALQKGLTDGPSPDDRAQMQFWLAMCHLTRKEYAPALLSIADAIKGAEAIKSPNLAKYVLDWSRPALDEGLRLLVAKDVKQGAAMLESVQKTAESLLRMLKSSSRIPDEIHRVETTILLGMALEFQGNLGRCVTAFLEALPIEQMATLEARVRKLPADQQAVFAGAYFRLLLTRGESFMRISSHKEFTPPASLKIPLMEVGRRDLVLALALAGVNATAITDSDRMRAYGMSGVAHDRVASLTTTSAADAARYRTTAVHHLEEACKLDKTATYRDRWLWCYFIGMHYHARSKEETGPARETARKKAIDNLEFTRANAPADQQNYKRYCAEKIGELKMN